MHVVNIAVRVLILLLGVLILAGVAPFGVLDSPLQEVFGSVVILFGMLRMVMYFSQRKNQDDED